MAFTNAEGREELLDVLAGAIEQIGIGIAALGAAYELLDEPTAERLEDDLFAPMQAAYGLAKRTHSRFAERHGLPSGGFEAPAPAAPSTGAKGFVASAADAAGAADGALAGLQDSMLPVDVGDAELRAALTEVRARLGGMRQRAREIERTRGR